MSSTILAPRSFLSRRTLCRISALAACGLQVASAGAQTSGTVVYVRDDFDMRCYFTPATGDPDCMTNANGFTTMSSALNGGTYSFTARAEATVGGPLKAQVSTNVSNVVSNVLAGQNPNVTVRYQAQARAEYFDQVTITGTTVPASLRFFVTIDGFAGQTNLDVSRRASFGEFRAGRYESAPVNGTAFGVPTLLFGPSRTAPIDGTPLQTFVDIPVTQGVNYLLFSLVAGANVGAPSGTLAGQSWSGTAFANYFNTANITGARIVNARGETIEGAYANFAGATNLNVVPEPSSIALLSAGLMALGVAAARRRRLPSDSAHAE